MEEKKNLIDLNVLSSLVKGGDILSTKAADTRYAPAESEITISTNKEGSVSTITLTKANGETKTVTILDGEPGTQGLQGPPGEITTAQMEKCSEDAAEKVKDYIEETIASSHEVMSELESLQAWKAQVESGQSAVIVELTESGSSPLMLAGAVSTASETGGGTLAETLGSQLDALRAWQTSVTAGSTGILIEEKA